MIGLAPPPQILFFVFCVFFREHSGPSWLKEKQASPRTLLCFQGFWDM